MVDSSATLVRTLRESADRLRALAAADPEHVVAAEQQLEVENAIAAGVAMLASEPPPQPVTESSGRPILARDLAMTADLVARALREHLG